MVREPFRADHSVHHNSPETLMQTENNDKPSMVMNLAVVLLALCAIGCRETHSLFSDRWQSSPPQTTPASAGTLHGSPGNISRGSSVFLSRKSRDNIGLTVVPLVLTTAWKVVELPAVMVDRPGVSDRGVTARRVGTARNVSAEGRRAAALDRAHHLQLRVRDVAPHGTTPSGTVVAEDVRDLQRWPGHCCEPATSARPSSA